METQSRQLAIPPGLGQKSAMDLQSLYRQAVAFHQQGALAEAEKLYGQLMMAAPDNFAVRHYLGVVRAQQGRNDEALALIGSALALRGDVPEVLYNHGNVLKALGRFPESLASLDRALALQPRYADALFARANVLSELKRSGEALAAYDAVLALMPLHGGALVGRGNILQEQARYDEALESFDRALAAGPASAEMHRGRGCALNGLGKLDEALAEFERAQALAPDSLEMQHFRARVLCESGRVDESFALFRDAAAKSIGAGRPPPPHAPAHRRTHDDEQQAWLGDRAVVNGPLFLDGGARLDGPAINPANVARVSEAWRNSDPQLVVIDDLLTPGALAALRRFCLGSNIWRHNYPGGYLGALPEYGFACPLLAQIAGDFRDSYPAIFQGHTLNYLWAFKYSSDKPGIRIHADEAAVNVNFWITPDDANLDPAHGGLVVWDKAAPLDWNFEKFNVEEKAPRDFLAQSGARAVTLPYRANRAVVFDSDLFHETDSIAFKDGYENRRINVTLLYGRRITHV